MSNDNIVFRADLTPAKTEVKQFKESTEAVVRSQRMAMRRGLEIGILAVQSLGIVVDQQLMAWIRVAQVGIETILAVSAASSLSGGFIQLGFGIVQVGFLLAVIINIRRGRNELASQMQYNVTLLRTTGSFIGR